MGLQLRITFNDIDYVYEIINSKLINKNSTEIALLLNAEKIELIKDYKNIWVQKNGELSIAPEFAEALGRSVSLRLRL
ncbi:hypothetical protein JN11_00968 [Mucilaginibacter frigoritolerans]|jgi:hypothetical protein|uniref:Uncharacterized protein n=1 Tax=Mucilaginibacter frigoritolerans TaxID=652788 RepID=A0A562UDM6_9SPHI|nr:hypothetical protein [Mucilaginibacter frigoritolerans]TWJ03425.1 hypothetical protein JN11_00968 [Mucilaginibacter frigoritolerans]